MGASLFPDLIMLLLRRFLAALTAPLIASVPAAFVEFAVAGQMPANFSDFLPVLHVVSRFGFAAALVIGVPAILALQRFRRFSFWSVLALGATLGVVVAVAVPLSGAPGTLGFTLACCALPGAVGAAWFWWIGGWSASPALPQDVGSDSDHGSLGATRWRRGVLVALATVALGSAAALLIPRQDLTGVSSAELQRRARLRPRSRADLFSAQQWEAAQARELGPGREHMKPILDRYFPNGTGIIPLDEKLLTRVTFIGMSVREVRELLSPSRYETNQPFGALHYGMWPTKHCAQSALILEFEPDRDLERRIVAEGIGRGVVLCVE